MADNRIIFWDRHTGGHVRVGVLMRSLPMLKQPILSGVLVIEAIDYRPGHAGCALIREHACGQREMRSDERAECDLYLRSIEALFVRGEA